MSKKKKRKATTEDETLDAPKSPSKKKAKTSKGDGSTPKKGGESEKKKGGPRRKDYDDIPSEPAKDLPEGWTVKTIPRATGNNKYDQRWYAPSGHTFNTKKGAKIFEEFIGKGHDDKTAYKLYEEKEKKAKDERKAQREAEKKKQVESEVV